VRYMHLSTAGGPCGVKQRRACACLAARSPRLATARRLPQGFSLI